jgi:lipopolysaccharide heptosyltransferase II
VAVSWERATDLLCIRLDALGDVVMTTPALHALRSGRPERRLTLLTSPAGAAVAPLLEDVDDVIVYEAPWMKASAAGRPAAVDLAMIEHLRARRFDGAVIFTVYSQSPLPAALLAHLAGIPRRLAHCHENPYHLLTDWIPDPEPARLQRHEVQRQLDLVAAIGCTTRDTRLRVRVPPGAARRVAGLVSRLDGGPWAVVHPGASAPSRRWPAEAWAAVAATLAGEHGWRLVVTGDGGEAPLVHEVARAAGDGAVPVPGGLDVGELAALLAAAPLLLANNTGPVHLACGVGTPVVDLYALTNPQHTPWGVPHRVLSHDVPCRWCYRSVCPEGHHACLRGVAPEAVVGAALALATAAPAAAAPARGDAA